MQRARLPRFPPFKVLGPFTPPLCHSAAQASEWIDNGNEARLGPFSECAKGHVAARPRKGDAILFHSQHTDGVADEASLHAGCPVVRGFKWTATKWIHTAPFRPETLKRSGVSFAFVLQGCLEEGRERGGGVCLMVKLERTRREVCADGVGHVGHGERRRH